MKRLTVLCTTLLIRTIGRLSTGISMSFQYGFISGMMLDYIYENKPHGKLIIGKWIDRAFLNNVGWQAIRQRKENLKQYLKQAITENRQRNEKTVILDIASGPAKYLLEVMVEMGEHDLFAICQDIDERWLIFGQQQANACGIRNIRFEKGDAFNKELLAKTSPKPSIVVSSGFYDWIVDDELVKRSFRYCYHIVAEGGVIVFTNQAGHKQMELVSEAFVDFNKEPLRMKVRSPEVINGWARDVGFKDLVTSIDQWGLYSVSKGRK
ncbi:MAG: class I SAM-dependent methyltransferase family protein [Candidatus Omnitrophica bacterium]|nr:class I SAM-dependent methyltransferase family protein [Candidatus Omnitrophota bacterium]